MAGDGSSSMPPTLRPQTTIDFTGTNATVAAQLATLFHWTDYLVFIMMLLASAGIGFFYGFFAKKKATNTDDFLMAGKSMTALPIAMSLIASFTSAITLLGTPSEVYQNGLVYYLIGLGYVLVMPAAAYLYLPVFWELQVTSAYEYLELRFHRYVRRLGSGLFMLQMCLYMAIVVYAPALALSQVTGVHVVLSVCLICFVCMFYTSIGGMKAVLWADTLQVSVMFVTVIFIAIYGTIDAGGFSYVWAKAVESGRAELMNVDPNPTTRHTLWSLVIGGYFTWITIYGCNQAQVQRYLCAKKLYMARNALFLNLLGLCILMLTVSFTGLVIYAKYWDCDPIRSGVVTAGDQLFPLFVMESMGHFHGLPGLFVAGIFSGALGTVSAGMNSLAAITLEDYLKGIFFPNMSQRTATLLSKILSLSYGLLTLGLVFVAQLLGNVLTAALAIFGIVGGPLLGMFTLGMFFPWANGIGCFVGALTSLSLMLFIGVGHQIARHNGQIDLQPMPTSLEGCPDYINATLTAAATTAMPTPETDMPSEFWDSSLFELSYMWYSATGCMTVIIVGLIVSFITGKQNVRTLNPKLLSPAVFWFKRIIPGTDGLGEDFDDKGEYDPNLPSSELLAPQPKVTITSSASRA